MITGSSVRTIFRLLPVACKIIYMRMYPCKRIIWDTQYEGDRGISHIKMEIYHFFSKRMNIMNIKSHYCFGKENVNFNIRVRGWTCWEGGRRRSCISHSIDLSFIFIVSFCPLSYTRICRYCAAVLIPPALICDDKTNWLQIKRDSSSWTGTWNWA